jgi:glycerophosphoryl diester phosphodiesterase
MSFSFTRQILGEAWRDVRTCWPSLLLYNLFFQLFSVIILLPVTTWMGQWVVRRSGATAISNTAIISFIFSPVGIVWTAFTAVTTLVLIWAAVAGMLRICWAAQQNQRLSATEALIHTVFSIPSLARLGGLHVRAHLLRLAPAIALMVVIYAVFLAGYDIYYLFTQRPPALWVAGALFALVGIGIIIVNGRLFIKWFLSLPAMLHDGLAPRDALSRSVTLIGARGRSLVLPVIIATALLIGSPLMVSIPFNAAGTLIFTNLPEKMALVLPALVMFAGLYIAAAAAVGFFVVAFESAVLARLYRHLRQPGPDEGTTRHATVATKTTAQRFSRGAPALLAAGLCIAVGYATYVVNTIDMDTDILITAHRGSSLRAPENSIAAIELAIEEGADICELDFIQLGDGTIVMMHDTDFRRIARRPERAWEVSYDQVKGWDVGSWFSPEYSFMRLQTLDDVLEVARGRILLNIELKFHGHERKFVERVAETLRNADFREHCIVTSLDIDALKQFSRMAPDFRTGAILAQSIGSPMRLATDVLAINTRMATTDFVSAAHQVEKRVHVWTLNDPESMSRFIDRGVDSIMTDDPLILAEVLRERRNLSPAATLLLRARAYFLD